MSTTRAWWCEHRGTIAVGELYNRWRLYCEHNRSCDTCHEILVTEEFLDTYVGEVVGRSDA